MHIERLLTPGIKIINKFKYPQKFGLIGLLLALFIIILLIVISTELNRQIKFIQEEQISIKYPHPKNNDLFQKEINKINQRKLIIIIPSILLFIALSYIFLSLAFSTINTVKYLESKTPGILEENLDAENSSIALYQSKLIEELKEKSKELEKALYAEKTLRKITSEVGKLLSHKEIDDYILEQLTNIFNINKAIHFHIRDNLIKKHGQKIKGEEIETFDEIIFAEGDFVQELIPNPNEIIVSNDIDIDLRDENLKKLIHEEKIGSFISYPTAKKIPYKDRKDILEVTMIANPEATDWAEEDKNLFELVMDTISIISVQLIQKQELEETRKTLISTLTHDLKNPVIAVQKILEFLLSPKSRIKKFKYYEYLEDMHKTNEDVLKLINNLLSAYHYESGRWELQKAERNINDIILEVIKMLKYMAQDKEAKIETSLQENLPAVNIDENEIKRVFVNLIGNAIKHNARGAKILIKDEKVDNHIKFSIQDNGQGIPDEVSSKLFHRYVTRKGGIGSGLGLYITKQIIEAHDGTIWFETEPDKGTTFYFTLPAVND